MIFVRYRFKYVGLGEPNEPNTLDNVLFGVWADVDLGDANDDLIVDQLDFLYVGLGYQSIGTPRDSVSNYFAANNTVKWFSSFPNLCLRFS